MNNRCFKEFFRPRAHRCDSARETFSGPEELALVTSRGSSKLRIAWPPRTISGDTKLVLLVAFLVFSGGLATVISGLYSEPLNRRMRRALVPSTLGPTLPTVAEPFRAR